MVHPEPINEKSKKSLTTRTHQSIPRPPIHPQCGAFDNFISEQIIFALMLIKTTKGVL